MNLTMPQDKQAEVYVLGSCINSINALNHCMPFLSDKDFYTVEHQILFGAIRSLFHKDIQIDLKNIAHELKDNKEKVDVAYLMDIANISFCADYEHFLEIVKNKSALRDIITASKNAILEASKNEAVASKIISETQTEFLKSQGIDTKKSKTYHEGIQNFKKGLNFYDYYLHLEDLRKKGKSVYQGVSSGYEQLDQALGTFQKSALYYIGARTSMGKTTFMCNLIRNMMGKYKIGIFSLEMPATNIIGKIACILANIKHSDYEDALLNEEKVERLKEVIKGSQIFDIFIEDPEEISCNNLSSRAKRMRSWGIDILFVDYLTRIKSNSSYSNKHLSVDEVSKSLQTLSKELDIPIVCFAQLNRNSVTKGQPTLVDFRESGSIEEDADGCLFIHRPSYYDSNLKPGLTEVIIAKNRLRGITKTIDYSCNYKESECYYELNTVSEEMKKFESYWDKKDN